MYILLIINKDKFSECFAATFATLVLFLFQPSHCDYFCLLNTSQHHSGVDPKDLCVAVAFACLVFDVAKALVVA